MQRRRKQERATTAQEDQKTPKGGNTLLTMFQEGVPTISYQRKCACGGYYLILRAGEASAGQSTCQKSPEDCNVATALLYLAGQRSDWRYSDQQSAEKLLLKP